MGRSVVAAFVVVYQDQLGSHKVIWDSKTAGNPTVENLEKWRGVMNKTMQRGGCNEHISRLYKSIPHISNCEIHNQKTGQTVVTFKAPMFEEF